MEIEERANRGGTDQRVEKLTGWESQEERGDAYTFLFDVVRVVILTFI